MEAYIGALAISVLLAFCIKHFFGFEKHKALKMFIALLPLTCVSAFRFNVGWDYQNYSEAYINYGLYGKIHFDEPGFSALIKLLYGAGLNYSWIFILFSLLVSWFFSLCYKEYGDGKSFAFYIVLFFLSRYYFCSMNIIRQALAMVMVTYSFHYIIDSKTRSNYFKSISIILVASLFHKLALMFIPVLFIVSNDFNKVLKDAKTFIIVIVTLIAIGLFIINSGYLSYFDTMFGNDGTLAISELALSAAIVIFGSLNYKKLVSKKQSSIFFNLEIVALLACIISAFIPTADRIIWYFSSVPSIFLIPSILDTYGRKIRLLPAAAIVLFLGIIVVNQCFITDSYSILPYRTVFDGNDNWSDVLWRR